MTTVGSVDEKTGLETVSGFEFVTDGFSEFVLRYKVDFYYGEYEYPADVEVTFVARDTKTIKGIWGSGVFYTNRNDKDANGNYTPMEITEEAKDASEVQLLNSILTVPYATRQKIRYHDKYQGACRLHWNPGSL